MKRIPSEPGIALMILWSGARTSVCVLSRSNARTASGSQVTTSDPCRKVLPYRSVSSTQARWPMDFTTARIARPLTWRMSSGPAYDCHDATAAVDAHTIAGSDPTCRAGNGRHGWNPEFACDDRSVRERASDLHDQSCRVQEQRRPCDVSDRRHENLARREHRTGRIENHACTPFGDAGTHRQSQKITRTNTRV